MALIKSYVFILEEDDDQSSMQGEGSTIETAFKNAMANYYNLSEWAKRDYKDDFKGFFEDWEDDFKADVNLYFISATLIGKHEVPINKNLY